MSVEPQHSLPEGHPRASAAGGAPRRPLRRGQDRQTPRDTRRSA
ncbi:hypothetical protein SNL152K_8918 [Streptomyces sp. NL15-2K]|nr:hypothetical protein SNL152K_8918 [Streptomyces sp. NL15-2K]